MSDERKKPKGARFASFGLVLCVFALTPNETGYQDIASLLARQPGVAERWQKRVFSAAANVQLATYTLGRPIGTSAPESASYRLANIDAQDLDVVTGSIPRNPVMQVPPRYQAADFPKVDRTLKGDRLVVATPPAIEPETGLPDEVPSTLENPAASNASVKGMKTAAASERPPLDPELQAALSEPPLPQYDISLSLESKPLDDLKTQPETRSVTIVTAPQRDGFNIKTSSLFFGNSSLGGSLENIERWNPGEEPVVMLPDPDMKVMASLPPLAIARERLQAARPLRRRARSTPTTSAPGRRPSGSACSTRTSAASRRSVSPRPSISRRAAKPCEGKSQSRKS